MTENKSKTAGQAIAVAEVDHEYATTRVPLKARRHFLSPLTVWVGYAFFPAGVVAAIVLGGSFSFWNTCLITLGGCLILALISGLMGSIGQREGMTFALIARFVWGSQGYKVAALIIPIGLIGWNSIHLSIAAHFLETILNSSIMYYVSVVVLAFIFGFVALKGFKYVTLVGYVCVPVVILLLGYAAYVALAGFPGGFAAIISAEPPNTGSLTIAAGVTSMVGTFACGAGGGSCDIQRWNKTGAQARWVAVITFGVAYVYLMLTGAITAIASGSSDLVEAYTNLGILVGGGLIIVFLTWTTCDADYYSASLSFTAVTGVKREKAVAVIVTCAAVLALLKSSQFLTQYLVAMAAIMVPLVGIAAADYIFINKCKYPEPEIALEGNKIPAIKWSAVISIGLGAAVLVVSERTQFLIPPLNCIIMSGVFHVILSKILPQKANFNDLCEPTVRVKALNAEIAGHVAEAKSEVK